MKANIFEHFVCVIFDLLLIYSLLDFLPSPCPLQRGTGKKTLQRGIASKILL